MTGPDDNTALRDRLDRTVRDLEAPPGLVAAAAAQGQRVQRRHRVRNAAGGVAALALAGVVGVGLIGDGPTVGSPELATDPAQAPSASPSPSPSEGELFPDLPYGWWDAPSSGLVTMLEERLPAGVEIVDAEPAARADGSGESQTPRGFLGATLSDDTGQGGFEIILYPPTLGPDELPDPVTTTDAQGNEGTAVYAQGPSNRSQTRCGSGTAYTDSCEEILEGGRPVGRVTSNLQDGAITFYEASFLGPEGGRVYLSVWNATDAKPGPETDASAPAPLLSLDQLRTLVQDPIWTAYRAKLSPSLSLVD